MNTDETKRVCIFCGHRNGKKEVWVEFARNLGDFLGEKTLLLLLKLRRVIHLAHHGAAPVCVHCQWLCDVYTF